MALTATNPAKMYGLHPRKGTIAIGSDADLALWDPEREVTITNGMLHHNVDYTPYEGMRVRGWPVTTISRGEVVWSDGEFRGAGGTRAVPALRPPTRRRRRIAPRLSDPTHAPRLSIRAAASKTRMLAAARRPLHHHSPPPRRQISS